MSNAQPGVMRRAVVMVLLLLTPALSGCLQDVGDGVSRLFAPNAEVVHTSLSEVEWNRDGRFVLDITHDRSLGGAIEVTSPSDPERTLHEASVQASADEAIELPDGRFRTLLDTTVPDGTWNVRVMVDGHTWQRFTGVRIDSVPPTILDLERGGHAPDGTYLLGSQAQISDGTLQVLSANGTLLGTSFPVTIEDLEEGVHVIQVVATDQAGNRATQLVQVIAGKATDLPRGDATFGIVSRYTIEAGLWDLARAGKYLAPADARAEAPGYLGSGHGITPDDPVVKGVADDVVHSSMSTMEAAFALYKWMFDELEYDEERLESRTLMLPRHVIEDSEDPDAEAEPGQDGGDDGLSDDGPGNGVKGGVCRDLAATYVSLLRASGIPARLVTGYLAGTVNGFHAWVEVYVGSIDGQDPWMPVDISPIDGRWNDDFGIMDRGPAIAMQSFGIRLPDYLPLRTLEADEEIKGWSTAIGAQYSYPSDEDPPGLEFLKKTVDNFKESGVLCVDTNTYARELAPRPDGDDGCSIGNAVYGWNGQEASFTTASVQIIDYGVGIKDAAPGTSVQIEVAYPFEDELGPVIVEYEAYGASYHQTGDGHLRATIDY